MRPQLALAGAVVALAAVTSACSLSSTASEVKPGSLAEGASLNGATLTVGSKEFTEQQILGKITVHALRAAGAEVIDRTGLSGSNIVRTALQNKQVDMYWEYTGTAWINFLKHTDPVPDAAKQYDEVAKQDLAQNHIKWLTPTTANNTYALAAKTETAKQLGVANLSDFARLVHANPAQATMCVASEFAGRNDGWPGLQKAYGFTVEPAHLATLQEGAIYDAMAKHSPCNFGQATGTDGRVLALGLTVLDDDKHFFPIYNPALTLQDSVYQKNPALGPIFEKLAKALDTQTLQKLNGEVDVKGGDPAQVATDWLQSQGLIGK
ncbi:glycine betaine ABC transporter substrate-binding protein [Pseudonocardia acaciae]|uniref:glycine betaine ABC transporter substrate-binding protein n=1 Tax=Pseudonocardia acaciae TaxID=551276 RepID=UPI00048DFF7D|nr:glycine betaine ABC transporter substrate-binding protein [Pseudonocardia acaciae]